MAYRIGGRLIIGYSSGGREFELAVPLAPFNPTTFAYTPGGLVTPIEADVGQTFLALAAAIAPYYDASFVFTIKSVWQQSGADGAMLPSIPTVGSVVGTSATSQLTDPPLMRGFRFTSALGNTQRVRLFLVETNEAGARRTATRTTGGFDVRDQNLIAYLSSPATGLRCWDGVPFPDYATVYVRSMRPPQEAGATGGGGPIVPDECLIWPLGGRVCNHSLDHMSIETPGGVFGFDTTGITLPGGHRLEVF